MPIRPPTKNAGAGNGGGGGSAGAVGLGPPTNTFADNTARDTYATNNPTWLAQYNANRSFWISVGTGFQRRNAAGNAWEVVTPVVQGADGEDGEDGEDGTQVVANPSGTDGDALTRISIDGTNYNVEGGESDGGGMAASWDRRLVPTVALNGWYFNSIGSGNITTGSSFFFNASAPNVYVGFDVPDDLRAGIKAGLIDLSYKFDFRVESTTSTTPVVIRVRTVDGDRQNLTGWTRTEHAMNSQGRVDSSFVQSITDVSANSGAMYIRLNYISSPGGANVTISNMVLEVSGGPPSEPGLSDVSPQDLRGITIGAGQAGDLLSIDSTDTGSWQTVDPSTIMGVSFDIWENSGSARNAIAGTDRFPFAWSQGNGQPNRYITFDALRYELQQPSIAQFDITGTARVAAGTNIGETTYRYSLEISNPGHVGAARIVGFATANGDPISPISPSGRVALATIAAGDYAHASGEVEIPANTTLTNAGDLYTLRLEVYEDDQTVGTDEPVAYHDFHVVAQASSSMTHFGHVLSTEAVADIVFANDDISTAHGVAGNWVVSGLPNTGLHRLYWAVPASDAQPVDWHQGGTSIAPTVEAAVDRTISSVAYKVYMFAAANAVSDSFNGQTIVVTT